MRKFDMFITAVCVLFLDVDSVLKSKKIKGARVLVLTFYSNSLRMTEKEDVSPCYFKKQ